jgi:MFS family permease
MDQKMTERPRRSFLGLDRNVVALGWVSLFMDVSSEMLYPLIPLFLTETLGASRTVLGLIEGVGESLASLWKIASGWISDRIGKRKLLILGGYGLSTASRPILALAGGWPAVLFFRIFDRTGKGIRTAPRDAIVAESTQEKRLGLSFGFQRTMDTLGAVLGPLIAWLLLARFERSYRLVFWTSLAPGVVALLVIALFVRETAGRTATPVNREGAPERVPFSFFLFSADFKRFLMVATLFMLGNVSTTFLILRAKQGGIPDARVTLVYLTFNLIYAFSSLPAGWIADRFGKKRVILAGYLLFAVVFFLFAMPVPTWAIWLLFALYGLYMGMTEGIQRAFVATLIPKEYKATAYGAYHTLIGMAAFPASFIGGVLWDQLGSPALFIYGAGMAGLASALFVGFFYRPATPSS